uniref:Transposase n=1 Tax=Leptobrachium leishanense TaxID=445787 RepID=A0A8C5MG70_9ANUR
MVRTTSRRSTRRTPHTLEDQQTSPITAYFGAPQGRPSTKDTTKMAAASQMTETSGQTAIARLERLIADLPTRAELPTRTDFKDMLDQMQAAMGREIAEVRAELSAVDTRVARLEEAAASHASCTTTPDLPTNQRLSDMQRRLDDLENRSRRHNIRVRGVHEGVTEVKDFLLGAFTHILGCPNLPYSAIDRAHRALRPRAVTDSAPPRDIICHIPDFALKEAILLKARIRRKWRFANESFELFQDLSPHTLTARRELRPITQLLREADIPYRWGFPFSLQVRRNNKLIAIRTPLDVAPFLAELNLPPTEVPDWEHLSGMTPSAEKPAGPPRPRKSPRKGRRAEDQLLADSQSITRQDSLSVAP